MLIIILELIKINSLQHLTSLQPLKYILFMKKYAYYYYEPF